MTSRAAAPKNTLNGRDPALRQHWCVSGCAVARRRRAPQALPPSHRSDSPLIQPRPASLARSLRTHLLRRQLLLHRGLPRGGGRHGCLVRHRTMPRRMVVPTRAPRARDAKIAGVRDQKVCFGAHISQSGGRKPRAVLHRDLIGNATLYFPLPACLEVLRRAARQRLCCACIPPAHPHHVIGRPEGTTGS